jgi:hypothetical protein
MEGKTILGVFGSRTLKDERVKIILLETIEKLKPDYISTCQEPAGVSEVAQRVSKDLGIPLICHFLNFRYLRGAFEHRAKEILRESTHFLVIHDGVSKGTANELKMAQKTGLPCIYEVLENTPYERSVGFNVTEDWDASKPEVKAASSVMDIDNLSLADITGE